MATYGTTGRRVAIVTGLRTPFAKAGTDLKSMSAQDLGRAVVAELVQRTSLDGKEIDALVFGTVIPSVLAPNIARLHAQDDHPRMQRLMTTSTLVISLASAGVTAALILTGRWLLPNLFGAGFAAAYPALVILAIGQFINSSTGPLGSFLTMTGNERSALTCTWMAALLNIALNLVLIPFFQTAGAAIATSLSLTVWNVMLGIQVYKRVGILPGSIGWWNAKRRFHNAREVIE